MKRINIILAFSLCVALPQMMFAKDIEHNTLSKKEIKQGWELLFDGKDLSEHWREGKGENAPRWAVEDGVASVKKMVDGKLVSCGTIVSRETYSAFELSVDFKVTTRANSGIKYFVTLPSMLGLEYQILDDETHPDAKLFTEIEGSRALCCLYDLQKASDKKPFNGIDEWNTAVIKAYPNNRVEHYLNGKKVLEYVRGSKEYRDLVQRSKYKKNTSEANPFGEAEEGYLLLQDHGDQVYFRNIKIRNLEK